MLKIRLQRFGRKHEPVFRVVLTDSKNSTKSGKFLENLGSYDARRGEDAVIKSDRISYWVSKGAKLSDTLNNLLVSKKIIEGKKINNLPKKKPILKEGKEEAKPVAPETPVEAEAPVVEEAKVEEASAPKEEVVVEDTKTEEVVKEEVKEETPKEESKEDSKVA